MGKQQQAKPTLDRKAADQINLSVIQRLDSSVEQVIATAGHVALYDFDVETSTWSRKEVEGSLFLVKRKDVPRFKFVILNKKGADNFWEDVGAGFNCELQAPYVLYRNGKGEVIGIWFYEADEGKKFADIFQKITSTFSAPEEESIDMGGGGGAVENGKANELAGKKTKKTKQQQQKEIVSHPVVAERQMVAPGYKGNALDYSVAAAADVQKEEEDDAVFWDKKVKVPSEVHIPGITDQQQGRHNGAQEKKHPTPPPPPPALQERNMDASTNPLAQVFAGMKVATGSGQVLAGAQQHEKVGTPPSAASLPLLTPQQLVQQAASRDESRVQEKGSNQGAVLLQTLNKSMSHASVQEVVAPPVGGSSARQTGSGNSDASHAITVGKVQTLLRALSENRAFCTILAEEITRVGLTEM
jgi:hypothetical protein